MSGVSVDAAGSSNGGPPSPNKNEPKLEGAALQEALRAQLEFYFSKQNLATDSYLLAQMNSHPNKSVPIDILAGFRKIKSLTDSKPAIIQALKQCKNIALDEEKGLVRSALKVERSTLILRDTPADASESELRAAFEDRPDSLCKGKLVSLTPDINDTWFVTFDSESTCMDVCMDIQSNSFSDKAYTYRGKPLQARVKNESLNRGFYTAPAGPMAPPAGQPSSILVGGPVGPGAGQAFNPYMQPPMYGYGYPPQYIGGQFGAPGQYMPIVPLVGGPQQVGAQSKKTAVVPQSPATAGATGTPVVTKAQKKAAKAAAAAAGAPATGAALSTAPAAAPAGDTAVAAAGDATAAAPKKKKAKKAAAAAAEAAGTVAQAQQAEVVEDKSHLIALYGHAPRLYSREQIAHVVDSFIHMARSNSALMKRPEGFTACNDPDKVVLKTVPSTSFSILDPFPVIYPASPSPLLAAQPHHSGSLPFLELGSGALDAPYFQADSGFAPGAAQGAGGRRKSKSEAAGKSQQQGKQAASNNNINGGKPRQPPSPGQKPRPSPAGPTSQQPVKVVSPPPAAAGASILGTVATAGTQPQQAPAKPTSFAAAALAAANSPMQQIKPAAKAAVSKTAAPSVTSPPAGGAAAPAAQTGAKKEPKTKKPKQPAAGANGSSPSAGSPAAAKPAVPVVNYASRVGAISPAELAAKQAAQKAQKEAADKAKDPSSGGATSSATAPAAAPGNPKAAAKPSQPAAAAESSPTKSASTFSYAAMIKKAPEKSPTAAAAPVATAATTARPTSAAPAKDGNNKRGDETVAAGSAAPKSDAGNWRSQQ